MLLDPFSYVKSLEGKSYAELVVIRDRIREEVSIFEIDYEMKKLGWGMDPSPSAKYQWNLAVLSMIESLIKETFHNEYEEAHEDMSKLYKALEEAKKAFDK